MPWTDAKVKMLRKLWDEGLSASEITHRLPGTTRNSVIGKAHRLGLESRPSPIKHDPNSKTTKIKKQAEGRRELRGYGGIERTGIRDITPLAEGPLDPATECSYIAGEPTGDDDCKCRKPCLAGSSFCPEHHSKCWYRPEIKMSDQKIKAVYGRKTYR